MRGLQVENHRSRRVPVAAHIPQALTQSGFACYMQPFERQHAAAAAPPSGDPWVRIVSPTADGAREAPGGARVLWAQRPSAALLQGLYPQQALRESVSGGVELHCTVLTDLSARCAIVREWPPGSGFGQAALSASAQYRARPTMSNGASPIGADVRVVVAFYAPPY